MYIQEEDFQVCAMKKKRDRRARAVTFDLERIERERHDTLFSFRMNKQDLEDIRRAAEALGVTVTSYLLSLHRQALEQLRKKGKL